MTSAIINNYGGKYEADGYGRLYRSGGRVRHGPETCIRESGCINVAGPLLQELTHAALHGCKFMDNAMD